MRISFSRVETYRACPYRFKLHYVDEIVVKREITPSDALVLGSALDIGIQDGYKKAETEYLSNFPIETDEMVGWLMQIEYQIDKVNELLSKIDAHYERYGCANYQYKLHCDAGDNTYIGFADYISKDERIMLDFKFSNNVEHYSQSAQLDFYELLHGKSFDVKQYMCVPKIFIRKKKDESLFDFRQRLKESLNKSEIKLVEPKNGNAHLIEWFDAKNKMLNDTEYIPICNEQNCKYCDYKDICKYNNPKHEIKPYEDSLKCYN